MTAARLVYLMAVNSARQRAVAKAASSAGKKVVKSELQLAASREVLSVD